MAPQNEDAYGTRRLTCHACNERGKALEDLRESPSEHGIHITTYRRY